MGLPRRNEIAQERVAFGEAHAQATAGFGVSIQKVPAGRKLRVDRVGYYNPTGLAAHADNWFKITLRALRALVVADDTFTAADTDICTATAHGLQTGDGPIRLTNSGGALPAGLAAATDYYVIRLDADTFSLATSRANALAGTAIDITDAGTGTHTLADTASTKRLETVADGIDTDSDTGAALAAATWTDLTVDAAECVLDAGEELWLVALEGGTATLPAGRFFGEARYVV